MELNTKKTLVVYYSYSGNNELIAEYLSKELRSDVCPILEENKRTGWTIFLDLLFRRSPKIKKLEKNIADYDHVIFLAPLWAGRIANPLKTLLYQERSAIKEYSFVTLCSGSDKKDQLVKVRDELQQLTGKYPMRMQELAVAALFPESERRKVITISGYHLKTSDLHFFKDQLKEIIDPLLPKETLTQKESITPKESFGPSDYSKTL